jgi:cytochrome c553
MRNWTWALAISFTAFMATAAIAQPPQQGKASAPPPPWAYGFATPPNPGDKPPQGGGGGTPPDNVTQKHVEGSTLSFTQQQIANGAGPADWFPNDHPAMPDIVAHGRREAMIIACALCHYPNGKGRPENAGPAGQSYSYIMQTLDDFKNGNRKSADPRKANTNRMSGFAKNMTDDEMKAAAQYFSSMKWTPWVKVVETDMVPKTKINAGLYLALEGNEKEPIGQRIIEVPINNEATDELKDPHSGFIAYVPTGAIAKGEALVTTGGNGKTIQCGACHGADLQGLGPVPGIAGRSPSYLARQLYDMQNGFRTGVWTELMKPVVAKLTPDDMINIMAYVSSRPVGSSSGSTGTPSASAGGAGADLVAAGKTRFTAYGCIDCHGMNGEGTDQAPDLIGTRLDGAGIAKFLNKPSADAKAKGMPDIPPTSADLQPLVAYVLSLKKPSAN